MRTGRERVLDDAVRVLADLRRPPQEARRRPFQVGAMSFRHVVGLRRMGALARRAWVRGNAPTGIKDFDHRRREAHLDFTTHERVRHAL